MQMHTAPPKGRHYPTHILIFPVMENRIVFKCHGNSVHKAGSTAGSVGVIWERARSLSQINPIREGTSAEAQVVPSPNCTDWKVIQLQKALAWSSRDQPEGFPSGKGGTGGLVPARCYTVSQANTHATEKKGDA